MIEINVIKWDELDDVTKEKVEEQTLGMLQLHKCGDFTRSIYDNDNGVNTVILGSNIDNHLFYAIENTLKMMVEEYPMQFSKTSINISNDWILHHSIINQDEVKKKIESILRNRVFW